MAKTICFTGRRPKFLCGYQSHKPYTPFVSELREILRTYYKLGFKRFITGGAQGFDQLAFWAVDQLKQEYADIESIVYVPFIGYGGNWEYDGVFGQKEYQLMLKRADQIHYCIAENISADKNRVVTALNNRNHAMVDDADLIIALYPEDNFQLQSGGTAECMRYAVLKLHKALLHLSYDNTNYLNITGMKYYSTDIWKPRTTQYDFSQVCTAIFDVKQEYMQAMPESDRVKKGALLESVILTGILLNPEHMYSEDEYRNIIKTVRQNCETVI